jgi:hypothetical protein
VCLLLGLEESNAYAVGPVKSQTSSFDDVASPFPMLHDIEELHYARFDCGSLAICTGHARRTPPTQELSGRAIQCLALAADRQMTSGFCRGLHPLTAVTDNEPFKHERRAEGF